MNSNRWALLISVAALVVALFLFFNQNNATAKGKPSRCVCNDDIALLVSGSGASNPGYISHCQCGKLDCAVALTKSDHSGPVSISCK
jgi:hypothetical protein